MKFLKTLKTLGLQGFLAYFYKIFDFLKCRKKKLFRSILRYVPFLMKQSCVDLVSAKILHTHQFTYITNTQCIVGRKHELSEGMIEQHRKEQFNGT